MYHRERNICYKQYPSYMKKILLTIIALTGIVSNTPAQHDDLYFVPKKKKAVTEIKADEQSSASSDEKILPVSTSGNGLQIDADTYNRRGSYLTNDGTTVAEFAMNDNGFTIVTEEGDTTFIPSDTLNLTRVGDDPGWINGFDGSDSDYEYAMRIIRFRNPRYAIPVSSPLYWDVVYGNTLWPSWEWNIYDDGFYAYAFPTESNWLYWDYLMGYPYGWHSWGSYWGYHNWHYAHHWGHHYGYHYGWYDPWYHGHYGWHHGPHHGHHPGFYPGIGGGKPGWDGTKAYRNDRKAIASSSRAGQRNDSGRHQVTGNSQRQSTGRVVTGRAGSNNRVSGNATRSTQRTGSEEVLRRNTGSPATSRSSATESRSRSGYTRQSTSRSSSNGTSYNRPSSTRSSSSSSVSRSSSSGSSRSSSYSNSSSSSSSRSNYSSSSRSSSYSSGSSSRSSSSYSSGSSRSNSYSGGSSRSSGSRR